MRMMHSNLSWAWRASRLCSPLQWRGVHSLEGWWLFLTPLLWGFGGKGLQSEWFEEATFQMNIMATSLLLHPFLLLTPLVSTCLHDPDGHAKICKPNTYYFRLQSSRTLRIQWISNRMITSRSQCYNRYHIYVSLADEVKCSSTGHKISWVEISSGLCGDLVCQSELAIPL